MWPDDSGSWSPANWLDDTGTTPQTAGAVSTDVLTGSTQGSTSSAPAAQDKWTGFFQNLVGSVAQYAVQKDAAKSGLTPTRAANGQPTYTASPAVSPSGMHSTYLVLGGVLVLVAVVALSSGKG